MDDDAVATRFHYRHQVICATHPDVLLRKRKFPFGWKTVRLECHRCRVEWERIYLNGHDDYYDDDYDDSVSESDVMTALTDDCTVSCDGNEGRAAQHPTFALLPPTDSVIVEDDAETESQGDTNPGEEPESKKTENKEEVFLNVIKADPPLMNKKKAPVTPSTKEANTRDDEEKKMPAVSNSMKTVVITNTKRKDLLASKNEDSLLVVDASLSRKSFDTAATPVPVDPTSMPDLVLDPTLVPVDDKSKDDDKNASVSCPPSAIDTEQLISRLKDRLSEIASGGTVDEILARDDDRSHQKMEALLRHSYRQQSSLLVELLMLTMESSLKLNGTSGSLRFSDSQKLNSILRSVLVTLELMLADDDDNEPHEMSDRRHVRVLESLLHQLVLFAEVANAKALQPRTFVARAVVAVLLVSGVCFLLVVVCTGGMDLSSYPIAIMLPTRH